LPSTTPVTQDAAAEIVVVVATLPAMATEPEPQLNPYQPNHKIIVPKAESVILWGLNLAALEFVKRPVRGPMTMAPTRPAVLS
jgi:hypothetical protein